MSDQTFIEMVAYEQMQAQRDQLFDKLTSEKGERRGIEAQRDRAVAALREIDATSGYSVCGAIARAALAELEGS